MSLDLQEIRGQLDCIDRQIVELFEKRMELCGQVAQFKIETGKPVFDKGREEEKLQAVKAMAHSEFNSEAVSEIMSQMMTISRRYQYELMASQDKAWDSGFQMVEEISTRGVRVVYQGIEGAYAHEAVLQYFGQETDAYHVPMWEDAMQAVETGKADFAVLPIENSSAGSVIDNFDLQVKYHNYIVGETYVAVNHALLGLPGSSISDIQTVVSHPQGLMQCCEYLDAHRQWVRESVENTAVAAKKVKESGDITRAAIASETAGKLYGLTVLSQAINHNSSNTTRFIVLAQKPVYKKDAGKISICFEIPHKSGSLYNILGNFIFNHVNMIMIESRPIVGKNWEYRFFVDLEGNLSHANVVNALHGISQEAVNLRILGNY